MKKLSSQVLLLIPIAFLVYVLLFKFYFSTCYNFLLLIVNERLTSYFLSYLVVGLPIFIVSFLVFRGRLLSSLGFKSSFGYGFVFALISTAPMLVGYAFVYDFNYAISLKEIIVGAVFAGFFEELYFRAFFFGLLFRFTKLGFVPALLFGALIFGGFHLYQSTDSVVVLGVFMTTILGAGFFAWLYVESNYNLWLIVNLHFLMNLSWMLFDAGENALGPLLSNVFRALTIASAILLMLQQKRKLQQDLVVKRDTLWFKK
ncbi:MAG: CPBP family glutamic-type intramembrane protease [Bacteroidales bacterium]|nr:CPBP family glutamic-type intramembrane protease [Bacteroidales bacterium]